jgi:hypothetical protein
MEVVVKIKIDIDTYTNFGKEDYIIFGELCTNSMLKAARQVKENLSIEVTDKL